MHLGKSLNQKSKILYVMKMLLEKTDENHVLSMVDIIEQLQQYNINAERKSIYDDINVLQLFGIDILYKRGPKAGYYIANREFELAELKLLVDAVQSSKFITAKKSNELIKKIEGLTSKYEAQYLHRQVYVTNRIKTMNESIYYNVDKIHTAISANVEIQFQYFEWTVTKEIRLRKEGKFYEVSPWALLWEDENYYLIGYDKIAEMMKHFRVDKMLNLRITNCSRIGLENFREFDTGNYAKKTFGMYAGKEEIIKMKCENHLIGAILDRFGKDITIHPIDDAFFTAIVSVYVSPQFYGWVLGLGEGVQILSPNKVVNGLKEHISCIMNLYEQDNT